MVTSILSLRWSSRVVGFRYTYERTARPTIPGTRKIGGSDQKNRNCSNWVSQQLRVVEEPMWKDFAVGGHLVVYQGAQGSLKTEKFRFLRKFSTEKHEVPKFRCTFCKMPGFAWADTYFGYQGDAKEQLNTSFMSAWWRLSFSRHILCILRDKTVLGRKWAQNCRQATWL